MTKENKLTKLDNKIIKITKKINALREAKRYTEKEHKNAVDMVENVPTNIYIDEWRNLAEHLKNVLDNLNEIEQDLTAEQSKLCEQFDKIERGA